MKIFELVNLASDTSSDILSVSLPTGNPSFAWKQPELFGQQMRTHLNYQRLAFSFDRCMRNGGFAMSVLSNRADFYIKKFQDCIF